MLRLEIYAVNDIPPIGVGKDTQLTALTRQDY